MMRIAQLLREAAAHLENMGDPFSESWLRAHKVTDDECSTLSETLAVGARIVAWILDHPQEAGTLINSAHLVAVQHELTTAAQRLALGAAEAARNAR